MHLVKRAIVAVLLVFLFFSLTKNIFDYRKTLLFYQSFKDDYEDEKKKNITLKTQILKQKDPYEVEKTIRNKLNLGKEGETIILLPQPTATPVVITPTPAPVYRQWLNLFLGN